jgi:protease-4
VFALFPSFSKTLDKVGVHPNGVATTWLRNADDPRRPIDPRFTQLLQLSVDHTYVDFTSKVAAARKMTPEQADAVAQGRVWSGAQAKERGLVDSLGHLESAIESAARRAKLEDKPRVVYIERDAGRFARLVGLLNAEIAGWVGAGIGAGIGQLGVPPSLGRDALRELGWVSGMVERGKPFATVIHCLCGPAN